MMVESFDKLLRDAIEDDDITEEDEDFELQSSYTESVDSDDNVVRRKRKNVILKNSSIELGENDESSSIESEVVSFSQEVFEAVRKDKLDQIHLEMPRCGLPEEIKPLYKLTKAYPKSRISNSYQIPRAWKEVNDPAVLLDLIGGLQPSRLNEVIDAASFKEMARSKMPDQNFSRRHIERDYVKVHTELAHELDDDDSSSGIDVSAIKSSLHEGISTVKREMIFGGKKILVTQKINNNTMEGKRINNQLRSRCALGDELSNIKEAMGKMKNITTLDKSAKEWENKKDGDLGLQQSLMTDGSEARGIISKKRFIENQQYREFHDLRMKKRKLEIEMRRKTEIDWSEK